MHGHLTTLGHYLAIGLAIAALGGVMVRSFTVFEIAIYCLLVSVALLIALLFSTGQGGHGPRPR